ncbi:uncharacterized protein EKO05_0008884 [Ascochyta rabiei]|uniref:Uncharacterized protein n=1 Tax=Didymella rabiei TaxID=5454 RepID=A0A163ASP2_DIDRA|nr:uncharacterized protein EKO05_0008884 [Ascochyta rabiei]KZM21361.1 hypothetical protein ST47_g7517 [Ascochyta rabiei]UPX18590.1 hypothetical protein EKO05_0008884 [Ascochyta rabiei]
MVTNESTSVASELLYSTRRTLDAFHLFPQLPANLRTRVLQLAASGPRTRFIEVYNYTAPTYTPRLRYIPQLPPLFRTSHETRIFSITHEGGELIYFLGTTPEKRKFYFNFARDIIFLSSRFTPSGHSTEAFRLRELSTLLPLQFLARMSRVVVTYSSLDGYKSIGGVLRCYVGLETLYVSMSDWWSDRSVKTRLRRGRPQVGYVACKVETELKIAEAEETDDESESDGECVARLEIRKSRRVVECELRLDE